MANNDSTILGGSLTNTKNTAADLASTAPQAINLAKGETLLDLYKIESDPIEGGMGAVYRVHHNAWNVDLAMKRPHDTLFETPKQKERFTDECQEWIELGLHPHIVSCYYVREIGGVPSVFAEWMDGGSLKDWIRSERLYEGGEVAAKERILDIAIQFARGLRYAHEKGLIHQDVKPDNLMMTDDGTAKVSDFGLARSRSVVTAMDAGESVNADGTVFLKSGGYTPAYASIEQMNGEKLTRRTDIYSWAVSVLEMYAGQRYWDDGRVAGLAFDDYLAMLRVPMPEGMADLLRHCLNEDEALRPHDFAEIEADLLKIYEAAFGYAYPRPESKAAADTADSLNNRALSYLDLGMTEKAEECWERGFHDNYLHENSLYNRNLYLLRRKRIDCDRAALEYLWNLSYNTDIGWILAPAIRKAFYLDGLSSEYKGPPSLSVTEKSLLLEKGFLSIVNGKFMCNWFVNKPVNWKEAQAAEREYERAERTIRDFALNGDVQSALDHLQNIIARHGSYANSPSRITLSEELGKYCRVAAVYAIHKIREIKGYQVDTLDFSRDGKLMLAGGVVFSVRDWTVICDYTASFGEISTSCFHPDGKRLAFADGNFNIVETHLETPALTQTYKGHQGKINTICYSADGARLISASDDGSLRLWNVANQHCFAWRTFDFPVEKALFSCDASKIMIQCAENVQIIETATGAVMRAISDSDILDIDFADIHGNSTAFGYKQGILMSDTISRAGYKIEYNAAQKVKCAPDFSKLLTVCPSLCFWDIAAIKDDDKTEGEALEGHVHCGENVRFVTYGSNRTLVALLTDSGIEVYKIEYQYTFPGWHDWDDGALPYIETFLRLHPDYTEADFANLITELQNRGYGWLRPEGVRAKMDELQFGW